MDYYEKSILLHKKYKGKLSVKSKVPIRNREDLSLAYTPGVGAVSSLLAKDPSLASIYTLKSNTVAVISDGSAVLGLGNIGPYGAIPVMEGKAVLFKKLANIDAFPICLNTQDVEQVVSTIRNIAPVFAAINLEDFKAPECFEIETRLQDLGIPVMHDDQHGTAIVVLAALINALKVVNKDSGAKIVINGSGAAGIAISNMLLNYGYTNIIICDSKGSIYLGRDDLNSYKSELSKRTNLQMQKGTLTDVIKGADVFIGVSVKDALNTDNIKSMAKDPIIFALANPSPEIMPEDAFKGGAKIYASGRSDFDNQINNVLAYPGVFRGLIDSKAKSVTNSMKVESAIALANLVKNPDPKNILPNVFDKRVVKAVSKAVKSK